MYHVYLIYHIFMLFAYYLFLSSKDKPAAYLIYHRKDKYSRALFSYKFSHINAAKISIELQCALWPTKKKTIKDPVENFRRKGSVLNYNRGASGRPVSVRTGEKIETVRASVVEHPNKSCRKRAQAILMKPSSLLTIVLEKDLKLTHYKMHNVQQLSLEDKSAQMEIRLYFQEKMNNDSTFINNVWFSDN